jgi:hypothetical protein
MSYQVSSVICFSFHSCLVFLQMFRLASPPPAPVETLVTRWRDDDFAGGSYSYAPVGAVDTDFDAIGAGSEGFASAAAAAGRDGSACSGGGGGRGGLGGSAASSSTATAHEGGLVFFAGEHTQHRYRGTVHGAFVSGVGAARRMLCALDTAAASADARASLTVAVTAMILCLASVAGF